MIFGAKFEHSSHSLKGKLYRKIFGFPFHIGNRVRAHYAVKYLSIKKDEKTLDAGCGTGVYSIEIASKKANVIGIDINKDAIRLASKVAKRASLKNTVEFVIADLCNLPLKENLFDKSLCVDVLEHIKNDRRAVSEIRRVLIKGGVSVIHVPQSDQIRYVIHDSEDSLYFKKYGHVREGYTKNSLSSLLQINNFEIIHRKDTFKTFGSLAWELHKISGFHWSVYPILYAIAMLDIFSRRRGNGLLMIAKKGGKA